MLYAKFLSNVDIRASLSITLVTGVAIVGVWTIQQKIQEFLHVRSSPEWKFNSLRQIFKEELSHLAATITSLAIIGILILPSIFNKKIRVFTAGACTLLGGGVICYSLFQNTRRVFQKSIFKKSSRKRPASFLMASITTLSLLAVITILGKKILIDKGKDS